MKLEGFEDRRGVLVSFQRIKPRVLFSFLYFLWSEFWAFFGPLSFCFGGGGWPGGVFGAFQVGEGLFVGNKKHASDVRTLVSLGVPWYRHDGSMGRTVYLPTFGRFGWCR